MGLYIGDREISQRSEPLVIAEIGINHEGELDKAICMVDSAFDAGCECVKFQSHVVEDEMIPNSVIPGNASESIWDIMVRCSLSMEEERALKQYVDDLGMLYLCTPFSRAAAKRQADLGVKAYKIGSGECNNYPLVDFIASFGRPIILSTGMNDISAIKRSVEIFRKRNVDFALLQCTSVYPTPYEKVNLSAIPEFLSLFPDAIVGLSDHSLGNFSSYAAIALGARIIEKHFTLDKTWPGPDNSMSISPTELRELIAGVNAVFKSMGNGKKRLPEEQPTIDFAYACVVSIEDIPEGVKLSRKNIWVKRPGTGDIPAGDFEQVLGATAKGFIPKNTQLSLDMLDLKNG